MRAAAQRFASFGSPFAWAAGALCACALLFSGGAGNDQLVWIGAIALALAAIGAFRARQPSPSAAIFLTALAALAVWEGVTMLWSISPDGSWVYTNRTLVYVAFAVVGFLLAGVLHQPAATVAYGAAGLLGLLVGWALLAKVVPSFFSDYGRLARLRSPVDYWNELALLAVVAVVVGLFVAARSSAGVVLVYGATVTLLLTYSRFGIALACVAAVAWTVLHRERRVEDVATIVVAGGAGLAVFGVALALPGITNDGVSHATRAHDGRIFAVAVIVGAAAVVGLARAFPRLSSLDPGARRRIERTAGVLALVAVVTGIAVSAAFAHRIWNDFTNPVSAQVTNGAGHLASASSSNRWRWWQEAWHAFTRHPGGGTGAASFQFTDELLRTSSVAVDEPHNTPLQFLTETGIVGLLLYLAAFAALGVAVLRAARRDRASLALGLALAAFVVHMLVDKDWNYVATCGPLLLVGGVLAGGARAPALVPPRRPLLAVATFVAGAAIVYSIASPWLADRQLASAATVAAAKKAHSYDPLSVDAVFEWAAFEDADGHTATAEQLYRKEVSLEPENSATWYDLGAFYASHQQWRKAYVALADAWKLDKFGPAGIACGLLDQARFRALGTWPPSCPGGRPASHP